MTKTELANRIIDMVKDDKDVIIELAKKGLHYNYDMDRLWEFYDEPSKLKEVLLK